MKRCPECMILYHGNGEICAVCKSFLEVISYGIPS